MANLLDRIALPVASEDDALASARALASHDYGTVTVIHVVEKAGGAPAKASVARREATAEEMFDAVRDVLGDVDRSVLLAEKHRDRGLLERLF